MTITVNGLSTLIPRLDSIGKQTRFALSVAINNTLKEAQAATLEKTLPDAFTLRSRGQPWHKPGGKFGFNIRPFATKTSLSGTLGSQADWLRLQEEGGTKKISGHRVAVEVGARPSETSVLPVALKPRRLLARKKKGGFIINKPGKSLIYTRTGPTALRLMYALKQSTHVAPRLKFEAKTAEIVRAAFESHFARAFANALATAK